MASFLKRVSTSCSITKACPRLASGMLWTGCLVPWNGYPAGDGRSSCSEYVFRGSEPLRTATFPGGSWKMDSLEIAVPWSTKGGRGNGTISWGHWGGTVFWGVYRSSPEGSAPSYPELSGPFGRSTFIEDDGPQIRHFSWLRPGAPPTLLTLRRGASGNAPFLDFSIWGASTLLGLTPPISPSLRSTRKILLKLVIFP